MHTTSSADLPVNTFVVRGNRMYCVHRKCTNIGTNGTNSITNRLYTDLSSTLYISHL